MTPEQALEKLSESIQKLDLGNTRHTAPGTEETCPVCILVREGESALAVLARELADYEHLKSEFHCEQDRGDHLIYGREWDEFNAWQRKHDALERERGAAVAERDKLQGLLDQLDAIVTNQEAPPDEVFRFFQRLHGLPEVGRPLTDAERDLAAALADARQLREALERIASCESHFPGDVVDIARAALRGHDPALTAGGRPSGASEAVLGGFDSHPATRPPAVSAERGQRQPEEPGT